MGELKKDVRKYNNVAQVFFVLSLIFLIISVFFVYNSDKFGYPFWMGIIFLMSCAICQGTDNFTQEN